MTYHELVDDLGDELADASELPDDQMTSHARVFHLLQTLHSLGPGLHPLRRIIDMTGLPKTTVHRILRAGVKKKYLIKRSPGLYGISTEVDHRPDASVHLNLMRDSALERETKMLQRRTAQVAMAFSAMLIDDPPGRLMLNHSYGRRTDFQAELSHADLSVVEALRYAPLTADAAGLAILAHLDGARAPKSHVMREILSEGYSVTSSPLPGWKMLGVPVWRGATVYGALVVTALQRQMDRHRTEYAASAMACAARLSATCELSTGAMRRTG